MNRIDHTYTQWIFHWEEDPCGVNVTRNLQTNMNARIEEIDEVEDLLGYVHIRTFMDVTFFSVTINLCIMCKQR
jgi:hypothetical protein